METESDPPLEGGWCAPPPASLPFHRISESSHHHHHHPGSTWKSRELAANSVNISQNPLQPLFCETRPGSFKAMGGWVPNLARMQIDVGPISELAQTVLCRNKIGASFCPTWCCIVRALLTLWNSFDDDKKIATNYKIVGNRRS